MSKKKSFVMYMSWGPMFETLPAEQAGALIQAIYAYQKDPDYEPEDPITKGMFALCKATMEEDAAKYEDVCAKRAEAAKASKSKQMDANASKSKQMDANASNSLQIDPDNESESDSDNDSDNDSDSVSEKESLTGHKKHRRVYADDPRLDDAIRDFIDHRKKLKRPMSDRAIDLFLKRLNKMTIDPDEQVSLINTAIERGWLTVYEPKEDARSGTPPDKYSLIDAWARGEV